MNNHNVYNVLINDHNDQINDQLDDFDNWTNLKSSITFLLSNYQVSDILNILNDQHKAPFNLWIYENICEDKCNG